MNRQCKMYAPFLALLILTAALGPPTLFGQEGTESAATVVTAGAMSNDDVIELARLGFGDPVIIAKIEDARVVDFRLETNDLVELRKEGVSDDVIAAMLDRRRSSGRASGSAPGAPVIAGAALFGGVPVHDLDVFLVTEEGHSKLNGQTGSRTTTWAYVTTLMFLEYHGRQAQVRTRERKPNVIVASERDPRNVYFIVMVEVDEGPGTRSLRLGGMGPFRTRDMGRPASSWTFSYDTTQIQPGLWQLTLDSGLEPGEYGVFHIDGSLYDFGIDE